jgi:predicted dehydrogenase
MASKEKASSSAPRYRAAIIGSGSIGRAHASGYRGAQRIDLAACADVNPDQARALAREFEVASVYTDFRQMLDTEQPDIVSVCTWHPFHAEMTIAAAARQPKAILCEKPMATSLGEAEEMMTACRRNKVNLAIGFQRRFLPAWCKARELLAAGVIGKPERVSHTRETGLLNATSHGFDCMRYVLGDPKVEWVFAQVERKTDRYERNVRCEDCVAGFMLFEGGIQGNFQTDLIPGNATWAFVQGDEGMLDFDDGRVRYFNAGSGGWKEAPVDRAEPWVLQAEELAGWIEERCVHRGQAENGLWTMHMMMGAYESARCHERVRLPMQTRANPLDLMVESGHLPVRFPGRYDVRSFLLKGETMWLER